jgi:NAD(P)-dependent dehydrogenase (short-subunit alcohol dehydrogenase family)
MTIALSGSEAPLGAALADALGAGGRLGAPDLESRASAAAALAAIVARSGPLRAAVHAWVPSEALAAGALAGLDDAAWDARCERPIRATINLMQAAFEHFRDSGGVIVVVLPTIGLAGQKQFAAYAAACEAQRCLVKSIARGWGRRNIRAHSVVAAPELFGGELAKLAPQASLLSPLSLRERSAETLTRSVVATVRFLLGEDAAHLTGTTTPVDAGRWMPL